jgi:hypothetical protein
MRKNTYNKLSISLKPYLTNPSLSGLTFESRNKRVFIKDNQALIITDASTGEQTLGSSSATFVKPELIDTEKFIKIYTMGIDELMNLSSAGLKVFKIVYTMMRENPNTDIFTLDLEYLRAIGAWKWSQPTFNSGLNELLSSEVLFKSMEPSRYFINVKYFFNGDRINIVKSYKLSQGDLLDELP